MCVNPVTLDLNDAHFLCSMKLLRMRNLLILIFAFAPYTIFAQYCESDIEPERREVDTTVNSITDYFLHGHINGHIRNYFMTTTNNGYLDDHYANATGGSIAYSTASWKGIHFGVKGIFTYNLFSSDLAGEDSTIRAAKWEQELFDVIHPEKTDDLDRLEELYIAYDHKKIHAKIGKIDIDEGPLLRRRDGRMKPFVYKGLWTNYKPKHGINIYNGFITAVSPRGMTEWYNLDEAIGILNNGHLNDTTELEYHEKAHTKGMLINGLKGHAFKERLTYQAWNHYLHHMYNTTWLQTDLRLNKMAFGLQYVAQFADAYQSQLDETERYFETNTISNTFSGQVAFRANEHIQMRVAYTKQIGEGRFVYPKELSRESFYTSIQRSWLDGMGQSNIYVYGIRYTPSKKKKNDFLFDLTIQHVDGPGCLAYDLNKYSTPDYSQLNFFARYYFRGTLEGLHLSLLYVTRYSKLPDDMTFEQQYYKTNLSHFNLVIDVVF